MLTTVALLALAKPSISGWVVAFNPDSVASLAKNHAKVDEVMLEWIKCTVDGRAVRRDEFPKETYAAMLATARRGKTRVLGMTSNYLNELGGFSPKPVQAFLNDPAKMRAHVDQLVGIAEADKLDGLDIDYESMEAGDRDRFTRFIEMLGEALRAKKKVLSVTVHPKDSEPGNWDGPKAQDWAKLGKAADIFRVMCYDMHWSSSDAGSIAGTPWAERVMKFAATLIPARKLEMGVACYGYDWRVKPATSLTFKDTSGLGAFTLDSGSGERVWGGKVHFSGPEAVAQKLELAKKLGLRGISMWYIGSEDPGIWKLF